MGDAAIGAQLASENFQLKAEANKLKEQVGKHVREFINKLSGHQGFNTSAAIEHLENGNNDEAADMVAEFLNNTAKENVVLSETVDSLGAENEEIKSRLSRMQTMAVNAKDWIESNKGWTVFMVGVVVIVVIFLVVALLYFLWLEPQGILDLGISQFFGSDSFTEKIGNYTTQTNSWIRNAPDNVAKNQLRAANTVWNVYRGDYPQSPKSWTRQDVTK